MDPAEQLQRIYLAGFDLQTFDRFPNAVGVVRGECIALLEATPAGLVMIGAPGWRMGGVMGVLVDEGVGKSFGPNRRQWRLPRSGWRRSTSFGRSWTNSWQHNARDCLVLLCEVKCKT